MRSAGRRLLAALALAGGLLPAAASAASMADFFGAFVGTAEVREAGRVVERRDLDVLIGPAEAGGFRVAWTTVTLVDGRRDVPGVKRRVDTAVFTPGDAPGVFVESAPFNPFRLEPEADPIAGGAVRWASFDGKDLRVHSFVVLPDGRYELQIYTRSLTKTGLRLDFQRIDDGRVTRRVIGDAVRAEGG